MTRSTTSWRESTSSTTRATRSPRRKRGRPAGATASSRLVDADAQVGQHPEGGVVADQPLAVAEEAARQPEELHAHDGQGQGGLGGVQGGPRDEPGRGAHRARSTPRWRRPRAARPAPAGRAAHAGDAERAPDGGRAVRSRLVDGRAHAAATGSGRSHDAVGQRGERGAVRHDQRGAPLGQPAHGVEHVGLGLGVEAGRRLVEDEERRVAHEGAGQGETLALAQRQAGAALAQPGVDALGQAPHDVGQPGGLQRGRHLGVGGAGSPDAGRCRPRSGRRGAAAGAPSRCRPASRRGRGRAGPPRRAGPGPTPGRRSPRTTSRRVDLPQPLGPVSATVSPGSTTRSAPCRAGMRRPG